MATVKLFDFIEINGRRERVVRVAPLPDGRKYVMTERAAHVLRDGDVKVSRSINYLSVGDVTAEHGEVTAVRPSAGRYRTRSGWHGVERSDLVELA